MRRSGFDPTGIFICLILIGGVAAIIVFVMKQINSIDTTTPSGYLSFLSSQGYSSGNNRGSILERLQNEIDNGEYDRGGYDGYINGHYVGFGSEANSKYEVGTEDSDWHTVYDYSSLFED